MAFIVCLMTAFFALRSRGIVRTFLATMLCSGIFNMRKVVLFKVLLLLRKVVRFWNFLCIWLPHRPSLVGADTSTKLGRFQAPNTCEPKKKNSWFRAHGTLPLLKPPSCFPWFFSLLFFFLSPGWDNGLKLGAKWTGQNSAVYTGYVWVIQMSREDIDSGAGPDQPLARASWCLTFRALMHLLELQLHLWSSNPGMRALT